MISRVPRALALLLLLTAPSATLWCRDDPDAQLTVEKESLQAMQSASDETVRLDTWLIRLGIAQSLVFLLQLAAFIYQGRKLRETVETARNQAQDMRQSIEHSARGASAMETVASALLINTQTATQLLTLQKEVFRKQLRAYISVQFQGHIPENRDQNNRHEVRVNIKNVGHTPAHTITVSGRLRVLPYPPTPETDFSFATELNESRGHLAPQDSFYVRRWLEGFLSPDENAAVKEQNGIGLYVFGKVTYKDIFDESWYTDFCCLITWDSNGNAIWRSLPGRNGAT